MKRIPFAHSILVPVPQGIARAAISVLVACTAFVPKPVLAAPDSSAAPNTTTTSRDLFRRAVKEYEQGKMREAYADYRAAWDLQKSYDIAGNLANVELELGHNADAADHASFALANFPPVGTDKQRTFLKGVLTKARELVGTLSIQANVLHSEITIDGKPVGTAPLDREIFVDPGQHTVVATAPEYEPARQDIRIEKGSTSAITLTLTALKHAPDAALSPVVPPSSSRLDAVAWSGFITAGGGLAVGASLAIVAAVKESAANDKMAAILKQTGGSQSACSGGTPSADCLTLHSLRQSHDTFATAAVWTFVGAGAFAAGTAIYALSMTTAAEPRRGVGFVPVPIVSPNTVGLMVEGVF